MRLSRSDLQGALDFLSEAGRADGTEPFAPKELALLGTLVRCDGVSYSEIDRVRGKAICFASDTDAPLSSDKQAEEFAAYQATVHEHPIRRHRMLTGALGAFKVYDFTTPKELRRTRFYADYLRHFSASQGFLMTLSLPSPRGTTRTFLFDRDSVDFDERDRSLLNMLQPHLLLMRSVSDLRRRAHSTIREVPGGVLSERETHVLELVAEGMGNHEIAQVLWIAPGTVRKHLDNIYAKLGVHNRAAAAMRVRRERDSA